MLIDTHCHLDFPDYDNDRPEVIQKARREGVGCIINIGSSLRGSREGVKLSKEYDFIYASVGIHPHEADRTDKETIEKIKRLSQESKVIAIGEIGLDYYKGISSPENQRRLFLSLLELTEPESLPVIIHCRQAQADIYEILKNNNIHNGVVHCFSGDEDFLKKCLGLGLYVSFTCNLTYKKAGSLRNLAKLVPLERLLLETDAPFLPPEGFRGKRNEPGYVKYLAEELAGIKGAGIEEVARITTDNARKLFKLNI
ncbi:MAG: TatD family hydrolase [Candidatus Omnitrophota bacterium]